MKHQNNEATESATSAAEGAIHNNPVGIDFALDRDQIERYIAQGQRLRAEATAAFFKGLFARIISLRPKSGETKVTGQAGGNPAVPA